MVLNGEISECSDISQGVAQRYTSPLDSFKSFVNDLMIVKEAAKQGVSVGEDARSGFISACDIGGIFATPECRSKEKRCLSALGIGERQRTCRNARCSCVTKRRRTR